MRILSGYISANQSISMLENVTIRVDINNANMDKIFQYAYGYG